MIEVRQGCGQDRAHAEGWDSSYAASGDKALWGEVTVPYVARHLPRLGALSGPVLEMPCGDGRNTVELARACDHVVAADISPTALAVAAERLRARDIGNVCLVECDALRTPFFEATFAGAVCWGLVHHLRKPELILAEMARVCCSGAVVVANALSVRDSTCGQEMRAVGPNQYIYREHLYFQYYDEAAVAALCRGCAGLRLIELEVARWTEEPHKGYREYEHDHESWVMLMSVVP